MDGSRAFFVVMNAGSGRRAAAQRKALVESTLADCGVRAEVRLVRNARHLAEAADWAIGLARARQGVVVAAGGDGTINAVVQQVLSTGLPFGALPQGTFNFFGRNHGLSEDLEQAVRDLVAAAPRSVQVGLVNDRVFLINASIGLYRRLLEDRERAKARWGRSRFVAMWAGMKTLLHRYPVLNLAVRTGDATRTMSVVTLVVGNNRLQLEKVGMAQAAAVEHGALVGLLLHPLGRMALMGMALRGVFGHWRDGDHGESLVFDELTVHPLSGRRQSVRVAIDGEVVQLRPPLVFRTADHALNLLAPEREPSSGDTRT